MPILVLGESNYAGIIPADEVLPAKVTGCLLKKTPFINDDGTEVWQYEFSFVIEDPGGVYDGTRLWGKTSTAFVDNPNCRLFAWAQEILGTELEAGFALDTDFLAGNQVRAIIGVREFEKNGQKQERNFVADVMRAKASPPYGRATDDEDAPF